MRKHWSRLRSPSARQVDTTPAIGRRGRPTPSPHTASTPSCASQVDGQFLCLSSFSRCPFTPRRPKPCNAAGQILHIISGGGGRDSGVAWPRRHSFKAAAPVTLEGYIFRHAERPFPSRATSPLILNGNRPAIGPPAADRIISTCQTTESSSPQSSRSHSHPSLSV